MGLLLENLFPFIPTFKKSKYNLSGQTLEELKKGKFEPVSLEQGQQLAKAVGAVKYLECSALKQVPVL
jgi:hypothetical protein